jgi:hypothetical protein
MNLRHVASCGLVCALLALIGCDKGRQEPTEVDVRVVNVAPGFVELDYLRETRDNNGVPFTVGFKGIHDARYDVDSYDFFVGERSGAGGGAPRSWTFSPQLQADRAYTFILTEVAGEIQPVVLENAAAPAGEAQIQGLHAAAGLPALDLYLERPGVGIAGATPRGSFTAQQQIPARTIASGDYELWLTEAGNPANVLLSTTTFPLAAGVTSTFVIVPEPGLATQFSVMVVQPSSGVLYDRNATAPLRVINGATDMAPRDFAINSQFSPPLFSAVPFAEPTATATVPFGSQTINVTPVGNPGVLELNQTFNGTVELTTLMFAGTAGTLTYTLTSDDGRRIHNEAKIAFLNAATQFSGVDFVLTAPGEDQALVAGFAALVAPGASLTYSPIIPGDYDLYLRQNLGTTVLSGPTRVTLASEGIYGVLAINGPDTATAGVVLFDDFP